jgi:opacity protein-like surface antigen
MKKAGIALVLSLLVLCGTAAANTLSLKIGYFFPRAEGGPDSLWTIEFDQMSFQKSDYAQSTLGFAYDYFLTRELSFEISLDTYNKNKSGFYVDYVGYEFTEGDFAFPAELYQGAFSVAHTLNLSITPVQFSIKIAPLGRRNKIVPYLGAGGGIYFWTVYLRGDIVDFSDEYFYEDEDLGDVPVYPIYPAQLREERTAFGYHGFAGFKVPVAHRITVDVQFRYNSVKGNFKEAFLGFEKFDLGGYTISAGINYWF